ncbi:NAD dependent epimerase/dehydratase, putative [Talaromyces stipitatus ATCC 10500]|uniref:NAD dependent epimerase/dehydratase, putative n=1 Tax=Talaromyces stipitatus (strain ATCC 10500 / CBS 375.48 / QM 6759 / NRRL 1006) TaxID=441959 RepID=B8M051_TALSN|nr:NAD dependent epimerase/dehydratase, putative [Talaromyces stipitatus ATCC 10500]EED21148.1 NAD dependent epimerase/dehydratase, putative [Talaromyces stipitatus ATCC 10500]
MSTLKRPTTLHPGERVLVTGANSYLASNIIDLLLSLGYHVRGTIRAEKPWLDEYFTSKYGTGKFESVIVPDVTHKESLVKVLGDISGVLHVASDLSFSADADKVINGVVKATQSVLEAAAEQKSVKRFVLTSSSTAATLPKVNVEGNIVDEDSLNDEVVKLAWDEKPDPHKPFYIYGASKTEGERFAFKWVKEHNPHFTLNTVLPNFSMGPFLSPDFNGSSGKLVVDLLRGNYRAMLPQYYVNVQDVARLHAIALLDPELKSDRLFAFAGTFNWTEIIDILRKLRPNGKLPTPPENEGRDLSVIKPAKRAEELIKTWFGRPGWVSLEQTLKEAVDSAGL